MRECPKSFGIRAFTEIDGTSPVGSAEHYGKRAALFLHPPRQRIFNLDAGAPERGSTGVLAHRTHLRNAA